MAVAPTILEDIMYGRKQTTLAVLRQKIVNVCAAISLNTLANVAPVVVHRANKCLEDEGHDFDHLLLL